MILGTCNKVACCRSQELSGGFSVGLPKLSGKRQNSRLSERQVFSSPTIEGSISASIVSCSCRRFRRCVWFGNTEKEVVTDELLQSNVIHPLPPLAWFQNQDINRQVLVFCDGELCGSGSDGVYQPPVVVVVVACASRLAFTADLHFPISTLLSTPSRTSPRVCRLEILIMITHLPDLVLAFLYPIPIIPLSPRPTSYTPIL